MAGPERKISKSEAGFRENAGTTDRHCGNCGMYQRPHGCDLVIGMIMPGDICKRWVKDMRPEQPKTSRDLAHANLRNERQKNNPGRPAVGTSKDMPRDPIHAWGYHLLLDLYDCNDKIDDVAAVETFFNDIIAELKMKTLTPIMIKKVTGEQGRGISAVQMITTSSITFHSDDDDKRSAYIDLFSCKTFNPKQAVEFTCKYFEPKRHVARLIYRDTQLTDVGEE